MERYERPQPPGRPCIVYSFGVRGDSSFEEEFLKRTQCEIFGFDFSVDSMANDLKDSTRVHFMRKGIGATETPILWTLRQFMAHYGHSFVDILKMDIEGYEFEVLEALLLEFAGALPFEQLQLEVHHSAEVNMTARVFSLMRNLRSSGVVPFMKEMNLNPCVFNKPPGVVEFSFYNQQSWFNASRWSCDN
jgi:hypothetical protein